MMGDVIGRSAVAFGAVFFLLVAYDHFSVRPLAMFNYAVIASVVSAVIAVSSLGSDKSEKPEKNQKVDVVADKKAQNKKKTTTDAVVSKETVVVKVPVKSEPVKVEHTKVEPVKTDNTSLSKKAKKAAATTATATPPVVETKKGTTIAPVVKPAEVDSSDENENRNNVASGLSNRQLKKLETKKFAEEKARIAAEQARLDTIAQKEREAAEARLRPKILKDQFVYRRGEKVLRDLYVDWPTAPISADFKIPQPKPKLPKNEEKAAEVVAEEESELIPDYEEPKFQSWLEADEEAEGWHVAGRKKAPVKSAPSSSKEESGVKIMIKKNRFEI